MSLANINKLHVKEIVFIYSDYKKEAIMVLIKMKKNARIGVKVKSMEINRNTKTYQNIFKDVKK